MILDPVERTAAIARQEAVVAGLTLAMQRGADTPEAAEALGARYLAEVMRTNLEEHP